MENYKKFKAFYDYTVENAGDEEIVYIMGCLAEACAVAMKNSEKGKKKYGKN